MVVVVCCYCYCLTGDGRGLVATVVLRRSSVLSCWTVVWRLAMVVAWSLTILLSLSIEVERAVTCVFTSKTD